MSKKLHQQQEERIITGVLSQRLDGFLLGTLHGVDADAEQLGYLAA